MKSRAALLLLLGALAACGRSPAYPPKTSPPTGALVIVIRQGPDRVPFQPKVDRIRRANEQLAAILGHSIQIELDGALLPQDHDGAEDVIARLIETIARDLDELKKYEPKALGNARADFDRLSIRYSPVEAERRGRRLAELDKLNKTIDVVVPEARWYPLERGEIGSALVQDADEADKRRYANTLPDALPESAHRDWFDFWKSYNSRSDSPAVIGPVDAQRVRGMLMLTSDSDAKLAADARKYLIDRELSDFSGAYHHHADQIEAAPADGPFHTAEKGFVAWMNREVPKMTPDEREKVAQAIWVTDFRKNQGDRFATYSFPGFDPMAFSLATVDLWIQQGHPRDRVFLDVVAPARSEPDNGEIRFRGECCDQWFYKWATIDPKRRDAFAKAVLERRDPEWITTAFYNANFVMRDEAEYLAFLRRFEGSQAHWMMASQIHRVNVFRPSPPLLEEAKRWWRIVPIARGFALFYFARKADGSYHPEEDWDDMLQEQKPDDNALSQALDLGWPAFQLLPAMWKGLVKTPRRVTVILEHARPLLDQGIRADPGQHDVAGALANVGRLLCEEGSLDQLAQLHAFATAEIAKRPGQGLSEVADDSDPTTCKPKPKRTRPPPNKHPLDGSFVR